MDEIYARMNDTLTMANAVRRAEASYGKLAQLKADTLAAEHGQKWVLSLCWWLWHVRHQDWDDAYTIALALEHARTA